ncbi:MAG: efflux RND transporter permease subunit, partial [Bacteroidetes bacterium]|nr:efflux RND transporter permease subunit [Bacteroidota bacterium]
MASLSEVSIKRPVLALVMSLVIILFGVIGFLYLGVREFPSVDPPVVTVSTTYTGANAEIIESQITEPLEESINGIAGIRTLSSSSRDGRSSITVEFNLGIDMEAAANDVRDRVSGAQRNLPPDVDPPIVAKADADASPIWFINVKSPTRPLLSLNDIVTRQFKEKFQTINGVSSVQIWGEKKYSMRLRIDPAKLAAYRLTSIDISSALARQNVELPSGSIEGSNMELTVRTLGRLRTVEDFDNMIVKEEANRIVRFRDVGYAELAPENERTEFKRDGIPMVAVAVIPQPGANHIKIVEDLNAKLTQIKTDLPPDIEVELGSDYTKFVKSSIAEVEETIVIAFFLVALIIFIFLRDWRSTLIPLTAIPISLIGTFFIMYLFGFSINVLTLLGIVLAIGLVVDDAIVVLENIYAKIEEGMSPTQAAFTGSREIYFAVISTTITLAAVFLPVIFLEGVTGRLFREFGIVVAGSVIISAFVSLTLTPMLSSRLFKTRQRQSWLYRKTEPFFTWLTEGYQASLVSFMRFRWMAWVLMVAFIGISYYLMTDNRIPSELAPLEDRSNIRINSTAMEGATFEYMQKYMDEVGKFVHDELAPNERAGVVTITSPGFGSSATNSGYTRVTLTTPDKRTRSQQDIVDDLTAKLKKFSGARTIVSQDQTINAGRSRGQPIQYVIQAPNFDKLKEYLPKVLEKAQASPKLEGVDANLKFTKPEIRVEIDREKAQSLGVSIQDVGQTLQLGLSGRRFGYFLQDGKQYQVIGQIDRSDRNDLLDLKSLYIKSRSGELVQMDNLVKLTEQSSPPQLLRFNRYISATISANTAKGVTLGEGISEIERIGDEVLDETFTKALDGNSR